MIFVRIVPEKKDNLQILQIIEVFFLQIIKEYSTYIYITYTRSFKWIIFLIDIFWLKSMKKITRLQPSTFTQLDSFPYRNWGDCFR